MPRSITWIVAPCLAAVFFLGLAGTTPGQEADDGAQEVVRPVVFVDPTLRSIARDYADRLVEHSTLEGEIQAVSDYIDRIGDGFFQGHEPPYLSELSEDLQSSMRAMRHDEASDVKLAVDKFVEQQAERTEEFKTMLVDARALRYQQEANSQRSLIDIFAGREMRGWRIGWCGLFVALFLAAWHLRRHRWRQRVSSSPIRFLRRRWLRAGCRVVGCALIVGFVIYADRILPNTVQGFEAAADELREKIVALETQRSGLQAPYERVRAQWLSGLDEGELDERLVEEGKVWDQAQHGLLHARVALGTHKTLAESLKVELESLAAPQEAPARYAPLAQWVALGLGVLCLGLTVGAFGAHAGWKRKQSSTCPLCMQPGNLEVSSGESVGGAPVRMVRCSTDLGPLGPCDFSFPEYYKSLPKLYFPTLGHVASGKTFWLAMAYSELVKGNYKGQVQFNPIRCEMAEEFENRVKEIIESRIDVGATMTDRIPHPLIFNFQDKDPLARSNMLVNIFDYSGEVTQNRMIQDPIRQRALTADGYFFFLDPTKTSEAQAQALVNFHEDVKVVMDALGRKEFRAPIALCVPKIDLLVNQSYAGPEVKHFYEQLAEIDPTGFEISLDNIHARSELMRDMQHVIWQRWNIENQIRDLFGSRFMFFPLTPVGLTDLGNTDLTDRDIVPYYILEPLLWLLQMNGYPVLS